MTALADTALVAPHGGSLIDRRGERPEGVDGLEFVTLSPRELATGRTVTQVLDDRQRSEEDRRVFELLSERWFFRTSEAEAIERGVGERGEGGERLDIDELREQIREASVEGNEGDMRDLARLAIEQNLLASDVGGSAASCRL